MAREGPPRARPGRATITTFLTFSGAQYGKAEEAIRFYLSLFPDSQLEYLVRHGEGEQVPAGELQRAAFTLAGQRFMASETQGDEKLAFSPAFSFYVELHSAEELTRLFTQLSKGGKVHMPLAAYPSSPLFAWLDDRYGISWQLELRKTASR
ncbi:MAG TPA: VOC family protein [Thermoplasmata archaeon]|nr:VOC family protein [Thermoplasmata archaeon]